MNSRVLNLLEIPQYHPEGFSRVGRQMRLFGGGGGGGSKGKSYTPPKGKGVPAPVPGSPPQTRYEKAEEAKKSYAESVKRIQAPKIAWFQENYPHLISDGWQMGGSSTNNPGAQYVIFKRIPGDSDRIIASDYIDGQFTQPYIHVINEPWNPIGELLPILPLIAAPFTGGLSSLLAPTIGTTAASIVAPALISGGLSAASGGDFLEGALKGGLTSGIGSLAAPISSSIGADVLSSTGSQALADIASGAIKGAAGGLPSALISGDASNLLTGALAGGVGGGTKNALSDLPESVQAPVTEAVTSGLLGKDPLLSAITGGLTAGITAAAAPAIADISSSITGGEANPILENVAKGAMTAALKSGTQAAISGQDLGNALLGGLVTGGVTGALGATLPKEAAGVASLATQIPKLLQSSQKMDARKAKIDQLRKLIALRQAPRKG